MPITAAIKFRLPTAVLAALCLSACSPQSGAPAPSVPNAEAQQSGEGAAADATRRDANELHRIESLVHVGATRAGVYTPPSEAELQAEYARFIAGFPLNEFHVAHILVPTERMAKDLIGELQSGAPFATLARAQSTDDTEVKDGDLGWLSLGNLPVAFAAAVQGLKPGQVTPHPVHTAEGWHVIKLLEARSSDAPPYDRVKAQLIVAIQQHRYEKFLAGALARSEN